VKFILRISKYYYLLYELTKGNFVFVGTFARVAHTHFFQKN